jgi:hypothetical protein
MSKFSTINSDSIHTLLLKHCRRRFHFRRPSPTPFHAATTDGPPSSSRGLFISLSLLVNARIPIYYLKFDDSLRWNNTNNIWVGLFHHQNGGFSVAAMCRNR